ncbi:MAG TPA: hypothetical protein VIR02_11940 [Anaerolineales bacterium]
MQKPEWLTAIPIKTLSAYIAEAVKPGETSPPPAGAHRRFPVDAYGSGQRLSQPECS